MIIKQVRVYLSERRWALGFGVIVMLVTTLPYMVSFNNAGSDHVFTGFLLGVEDGNTYIAKMLSGSYGVWMFRTPYTAYPQKGVLLYLLYILAGKLAAPPDLHVQLVVLYHFLRICGGFLAVFATYDFMKYFLNGERWRRFGLVLAVLGGGLGWVLLVLGRNRLFGEIPLDFYSPETFGFLGIYSFPHLAIGRAFLLWTLLAYLKIINQDDLEISIYPTALRIGILWLLGGLLQPLIAVVVGGLIILHWVWILCWRYWLTRKGSRTDWKRLKKLLIIVVLSGILPGIYVIYNLWSVYQDPFLQQWTAQNIIHSPHPIHYLLAFGLAFPYVLVGSRRLMRLDPWFGSFPVVWALVLPLLAYAPLDLQRRLPEGIWVAWVVLVMVVFDQVGQEQGADRRFALPLLLLFPSTVLILVLGFQTASAVRQPVFRQADEVEIFEYLGAIAEPGEVVITSYLTGNALPAWAPLRVVIGHGPESVWLAELRPQVEGFYSSDFDELGRLEFIRLVDASIVFWGPAERRLGDWDPNKSDILKPIKQIGEYAIFEVDGDLR